MIAIPSISSIRGQLLTNWRNLDPEIQTHPYSDEWIRANAVASVLWGLYARADWVARQLFPGTADTAWLEQWAGLYGLLRTPATTATGGQATFTGNSGTVIEAGSVLVHADGTLLVTVAEGVIGGAGTLNIEVASQTTGIIGNKQIGDVLTLQSPPVGAGGTAEIAVALTGGAEAETDLALRTRLLLRLQQPPAGGKATDYATWAKTVQGVLGAWVYSGRRGPGSVDVVPWTDADDRMPSNEQLVAVESAIEAERPVSAWDYLVLAPDLTPVNVTGTITLAVGADEDTVLEAVEAAISAHFATLAPGARLFKSQLEAVVSAVVGVVDRTMTAPSGNVNAVVDNDGIELLTLGTVSMGVV